MCIRDRASDAVREDLIAQVREEQPRGGARRVRAVRPATAASDEDAAPRDDLPGEDGAAPSPARKRRRRRKPSGGGGAAPAGDAGGEG